MPVRFALLVALAVAGASSVHAQSGGHAGHGASAPARTPPAPAAGPGGAPPAAAAAASLADGEVLRVNRDTRRLRIRHGEIRSLDMPPMTMEFEVADAAMLDAVKAGDRIRFAAEERRGQYFVTRIEPVR